MPAKREFGARQVRVILLVIVGLALLVYGVYQVGQIFDVFAKRYTLVTMVSDVAGLREGAPVTIAGQRVGQVSRIDFIPPQRKRGSENLVLHLDVSERVRDQIRRDSRAFMRAQGLLGDKYVDISPGTPATPPLAEMDTLRAEEAMDIEQFLVLGSSVLDSASRAVADLRRLTAGLIHGKGTMGQLLTNDELYLRIGMATTELQTTLEQLSSPESSVGRMMRDPALYNRLVSAAARVDSLGGALLRGHGTLGRLVQSDSLYRRLLGGASRADSAVTNFSGFLEKMTNGNGSMQRLATDPKLYDEFLKSVVDLQTLIADIRANPKKFVPPVNVKIF